MGSNEYVITPSKVLELPVVKKYAHSIEPKILMTIADSAARDIEKLSKLETALQLAAFPVLVQIPTETTLVAQEGPGNYKVPTPIGSIFVHINESICLHKDPPSEKYPFRRAYAFPTRIFTTLGVPPNASPIKALVDTYGIFPSFLLETDDVSLTNRIINPMINIKSSEFVGNMSGKIYSVQQACGLAVLHFCTEKGLVGMDTVTLEDGTKVETLVDLVRKRDLRPLPKGMRVLADSEFSTYLGLSGTNGVQKHPDYGNNGHKKPEEETVLVSEAVTKGAEFCVRCHVPKRDVGGCPVCPKCGDSKCG